MDNASRFRVVKTTIRTGCDLAREVVKSNLNRVKANTLKGRLDRESERADFDPANIVSYLVEPA